MDNAGGKVLGMATRADFYFSNFSLSGGIWRIASVALDIIIVTVVFYWLYKLVRDTRGMRIIYGIVFLVVLTAIGRYLQLSAFNFVLKYLSTMIVVAIPVVLQPELRSALERLGRTNIVADVGKLKKRDVESLLNTIVEAVDILGRNRIGALIVIGRETGLREYIETGTPVNAAVTTELLLTIFTPKTPLHDGAVVIIGNKLVAAGCTLPLSDVKLNLSLGTRHRAAIGMAAQTDALVIVVSEENGKISLALDGRLQQNLTREDLRERLATEFHELRNIAAERK